MKGIRIFYDFVLALQLHISNFMFICCKYSYTVTELITLYTVSIYFHCATIPHQPREQLPRKHRDRQTNALRKFSIRRTATAVNIRQNKIQHFSSIKTSREATTWKIQAQMGE
jgi:hypothetical protein